MQSNSFDELSETVLANELTNYLGLSNTFASAAYLITLVNVMKEQIIRK